MKIGGSTDGVGGLRPKQPATGPDGASGPQKAFETAAGEKASEAAATDGAAATGSPALDELRKTVGSVPTDPEAATLSVVKGLLKSELGEAAENEPGFEKMAEAIAEKVKQDPVLGDTLKRVLGELARP